MITSYNINSFQFFVLVLFFTIGSSIIFVPSHLAQHSEQDAWIASIMGILGSIVIVYMYTLLAGWFPGLNYIAINKKIFGGFLGSIFSIFFIILVIIFAAILLADAGSFLTTQMLPKTPPVIINALLALLVVVALRLGLNTLALSAEILLFIFLIFFSFLVLSTLSIVDTHNLLPVFQKNIGTLADSSLFYIVISTTNSLVLLMVYPYVSEGVKKAKKAYLFGNFVGGVLVFIVTILCIAVLSAPLTSRLTYPSYYLAKQITIGDAVSRIEALMAGIWIISIFLKLCLYFFAAIFGIVHLFRLKNYKLLCYPIGIIVTALSIIIFPNVVVQRNFVGSTVVSMSIFGFLFIPILMMLVYSIRRKSLKAQNKTLETDP
ncbi:endospore germination permease [Psychrobacillus sp. FSL K6-2684]|uniref:GerAB/ArcD/ProY family transporter n=1 Tax=Psychrobacillus TaxID=1221880 RepID=UPI00124767F6|nr:endospore germination permease [Psychrobacillus faecigallinarum]QEY19604.1 spore gernimation protein [Psychrobacillus sp. AK 1817]